MTFVGQIVVDILNNILIYELLEVCGIYRYYYCCRRSDTPPPVAEWVRVATCFTEHRKSATQVDDDDVRQAARVLLPNCDCPVRPIRFVFSLYISHS